MKRMVMFSIAMLVVSSTAFASQSNIGRNDSGQRRMVGEGGAGQRHNNQGGGYNRGGLPPVQPSNVSPARATLGGNSNTWAPVPASALTPARAILGGNSDTWAPKNATPKHINVARAIVHEGISRLYAVMSNITGTAMTNLQPHMENLEVAASKLNIAMSMVKRGQSMLTPAQTKLVNDAMSLVNQVVMDPHLINLFPASHGMTGGGNATNTPGFTGGNHGATNAPIAMTPLDVFVNGVGTPTGSMTGGTGHGSTQQQGNLGQGGAGQNTYQTMNPAENNLNAARARN
ncbi:MAG: hypothetical protein EBY16_09260 [Gammaproteobacteria bacterium]|nr:hypothetical protein [Gammaproteobacteria bacterium]